MNKYSLLLFIILIMQSCSNSYHNQDRDNLCMDSDQYLLDFDEINDNASHELTMAIENNIFEETLYDEDADITHEEPYSFEQHLLEAIEINKERKPLYAKMSMQESVMLSTLLIKSEEQSLPIARSLDERSKPFHDEGIMIVANDFVSMEHIKDYTTVPPRQSTLTSETKTRVNNLLSLMKSVDPSDFKHVADLSYQIIIEIKEIELSQDIHLIMSKHMIESIGIAALHAIDYSKQSNGRTDELAKDLIKNQIDIPFLLNAPIELDAMANKLHQKGIGILYNDIPHIPFVEEYEAYMN